MEIAGNVLTFSFTDSVYYITSAGALGMCDVIISSTFYCAKEAEVKRFSQKMEKS